MTREFRRAWQVAAVVGLALGVLYLLTAQRGVSWQDSGEFQRRAWLGDLAGVEGVARAHPLYVAALHAITRVFPPPLALWGVNAFSGLGMAVAAAACAWLVQRLTRNTLAAVVAGSLLGLAHMAWWMAAIAEVYTWSLALFLVETALLYAVLVHPQPRTLFWLALTSGLGLAVHHFALLSLPVWAGAALWLIRRRALPGWSLAPAAVAWLAGASPLLALVTGAVCGAGHPWEAINDALFGGSYRRQVLGLTPSLSPALVLGNLALFALSLASPLWAAAAYGWRRRHFPQPQAFTVCLALLTLIHVIFFARYFVPDQATFCLPTLGLMSIWVGVGLAAFFAQQKWSGPVCAAVVCAGLVCPILVYSGSAAIARACHWKAARARVLPFRDEARYWLLPWKNAEHSAVDFAQAALSQCGRKDVIYADSTAAGPLVVTLLTEPARRDRPRVVTYYDTWTQDPGAWSGFLAALADRPFHVVSPVPGYVPAGTLNQGWTFAPTGVLYRAQLTPVRAASDRAPGGSTCRGRP